MIREQTVCVMQANRQAFYSGFIPAGLADHSAVQSTAVQNAVPEARPLPSQTRAITDVSQSHHSTTKPCSQSCLRCTYCCTELQARLFSMQGQQHSSTTRYAAYHMQQHYNNTHTHWPVLVYYFNTHTPHCSATTVSCTAASGIILPRPWPPASITV
jgi:hypothetical protein